MPSSVTVIGVPACTVSRVWTANINKSFPLLFLNIPAGGKKFTASGAKRAEQITRDNVALDLRCPSPYPLDTGVSPKSFQWQVVHQAHATINLYCPVCDAGQHFCSVKFR